MLAVGPAFSQRFNSGIDAAEQGAVQLAFGMPTLPQTTVTSTASSLVVVRPSRVAAAASLERRRANALAGTSHPRSAASMRFIAGARLAEAGEILERRRLQEVAEGDRVDIQVVLHSHGTAARRGTDHQELHDPRGVRDPWSSPSTSMCAVPVTSQVVRRPYMADDSGEFAMQTGASPGAFVAVTLPATGSKSEQSGSTGFSMQGHRTCRQTSANRLSRCRYTSTDNRMPREVR